MSFADMSITAIGMERPAPIPVTSARRPLQRLADVRRTQGISRRTVARKLRVDVHRVKQMEQADSDLALSTLYAWQEVLDVPIAELLVEADEPLSTPVLKRAQLVRLMKTVMAIKERSQQVGIRRMAEVLAGQLVEIMPELAEVTPWHAVGKRRSQNEVGQAAHRRLSLDFLPELEE